MSENQGEGSGSWRILRLMECGYNVLAIFLSRKDKLCSLSHWFHLFSDPDLSKAVTFQMICNFLTTSSLKKKKKKPEELEGKSFF